MESAFYFLVGGLGGRLRGSAGSGGWVEKIFRVAPGTRLGRMFWCVPVAALIAHATNWWLFLPLLASAYLGVMSGYFGGRFDLSLSINRNPKNYAWLSFRGFIIALPICLCLLAARNTGLHGEGIGWGGMLSGLMMPLNYLTGLKLTRINLPTLHGHTEWGEFLTYGFILTAIMGTI